MGKRKSPDEQEPVHEIDVEVKPETDEEGCYTENIKYDNDIDWEGLRKPFDKKSIKKRELTKGGKKIDYVDGTTVIRRLNKCCGAEWDFHVDKYWLSDDGKKAYALCTLTIGTASRQHIGMQEIGHSGADAEAKGAITDGLKKCATLFGVGLELYGPDYEDDAPVGHRLGLAEKLAPSSPTTPEPTEKPAESVYRQSQEARQSGELEKPTRGTDGAPLTDKAQLSMLHRSLSAKVPDKSEQTRWLLTKCCEILGDDFCEMALGMWEEKPWHFLSKLQVLNLKKELDK